MKRFLTCLSAAAVLLTAACAVAGKTDNLFTVDAPAVTAKAGEKARAQIVIKVKPEGHISNEAPLKATLTAKNATLEKEKLAKADATYKDGGAVLPVDFTAGTKGEGSLEANLVFFMCSKEICERHERKLTLPVTVQ